MLSRSLALLPAALLVACASAPPLEPPPPVPPPLVAATQAQGEPGATPSGKAAVASAELPPLAPLHDDLEGARAKARAQGKALFVDAWAPWCHTCLSMKHYVLDDPSLRPLADRVVFVELDTDRPENEAFVERYKMSVWPTFFVLDPADGEVMSLWSGAASVEEVRAVVEEGARAVTDRAGAAKPEGHPDRLLASARKAQSAGDYTAAAAAYGRALDGAGQDWPRRSEALYGRLQALYKSKDLATCTRFGREHLTEVKGAAQPADFASYLLTCARALPDKAAGEQRPAREAAIAQLRTLTRTPPPGSTPDDRADALGILASALKDTGDTAGARQAQEARLALLEQAAKEAKTPEMAATHDYLRSLTYQELGRGDEAVAMLKERERQLPDLYEPPARLAQALHALDRNQEALAAVDRALARSYGPRKTGYLKLKAQIQLKLGDKKGAVETLRAEVAAHEALAPALRREEALTDAKKRLAEAEKGPAPKIRASVPR
ncbi:thioredoxin family protein [Chondromyces apiculatus]|uniref:Thioredoxin domain-containing protein n=1 Tax=Chondromyces apiculatus DSM 436 TaxID=1192034 RepID=A0A017SXD7_9BACT|nr:thioredoxin family protein [Chondromyces apiculatus]EYF01598.1 Hypothetical protein CAP_8038 [Chondromyces apiculatus DSM 436]